MKNKGVIFGGGKLPKTIDLTSLVKDKLVIAADSGYDKLCQYNINVDYLLGDFDSIKTKKENIFDAQIINPSKEEAYSYTDMELAINLSLDMGLDQVYLIGALGSRQDHSLANIMLLKKYSENKKVGIILDDYNRITIQRGQVIIKKSSYKYLSLIPIYDKTIISLDGFKYPLDKESLNISDSLTISNEIKNDQGKILANKDIIIIQSND